MIRIHSFDVFDTCLTRKTATPTSAFYEVARDIFQVKGTPTNNGIEEEFVANRIVAELEAREQTDRDDVTLEMIWRRLAVRMNWPFELWMPQCEMDVEDSLLSPVSEMRKQVNVARDRGCRIIFVSDMYLPEVFIRRQLIKHGFAREGDGVYVSGELGLTKAKGNLFRHILEVERVSASELAHVGDNQLGDFTIPKQLGIHAELFTQAYLNSVESSILKSGLKCETATRFAGGMRSFRVMNFQSDRENVHALTAEFVGPFIMGFASWVLQRAKEKNIQRLYFFSRDCQLLCKAATLLAPRFGGIDCRYLYVSRQSLFLPSADSISQEAMPWIGQALEQLYLKNILAKLELNYEQVADQFLSMTGSYGEKYVIKSESDWQKFWIILNSPTIKPIILKLIHKRRICAQTYFKQAGLLDDVAWGVVDFGWVLQGQASMQKMLLNSGWQGEIEGFYLGLVTRRSERSKAGKAEAIFYQPSFDSLQANKYNEIFRRIPLLEHIVGLADHATVNHYAINLDGKAEPISVKSVSDTVAKLSRLLHEETIEFIKNHQFLVDELRRPEYCREFLGTLVDSFFKTPSHEAVIAVKDLNVSMDQNEYGAKPVVKEWTWIDALLPLLPGRQPFTGLHKKRESIWLEGAFLLAPPYIRFGRKTALHLARWRSQLFRKLLGHR